MTSGTVSGLWRYPVKSMRGEGLDAAAAGERGLRGDRAYAILDCATGKVASAKHPRLWGRLLACHASIAVDDPAAPPPVRITLPDGRVVSANQGDCDAVLSAALGRAVTLSAQPPAGAEIERDTPDVEGLPRRGTFSSGAIGLGAPPGTFFDYAPLHLLTTASLDRLRALHPEGQIEAQRFRPNLLIAPPDGVEGFVENAWVGHTLLIGTQVRLRLTDPAPRCVVPTLAQDNLPQDMEILRTIVRHNWSPVPALGGQAQPGLGVYAVVERGGIIRRGDAVRLVDRRRGLLQGTINIAGDFDAPLPPDVLDAF